MSAGGASGPRGGGAWGGGWAGPSRRPRGGGGGTTERGGMGGGRGREPVQVEGDLFSLMACNDKGSQRLREMLEEFGLDTIEQLAAHIVEHSREATLEQIRKLRTGTYVNSVV